MMVMHRRAAWGLCSVLATVFAASTAFAQSGNLEKYDFKVDAKVVESTLTVFPQINETYQDRPLKPSNPKIQIKSGTQNTLFVGRNRNVNRGIVQSKFPGIGATGWFPPDPTAAAGPTHMVETVNSAIAFFDKKTGTKTFQQDLGRFGFFASLNVTDFVFDPKVFYDQVSKRYFVIALELAESSGISKCLIAVSDDSNPDGNWFKYRIEAKLTVDSVDYWLDYPGWGFNKDGVVVTGNMFEMGGGGFAGVQFIAMPKAKMLDGSLVDADGVRFRDDQLGSAQVAHTYDAANDNLYCCALSSFSSMRIYSAHGFTGTIVIDSTDVTIPAFTRPDLATSMNGAGLDALDGRALNLAYRAGKVVATHTVGVSGSDATPMIRWYEFNVGTWPTSGSVTLGQSGNVRGGPGESAFMGSIASNKLGDIAIVFSRSSSSVAADVVYVGRKKTDPPGTMGKITLLQSSSGAFGGGGNRWGDYSSCEVDPVDDVTFWGCAELIRNDGNWSTTINKFQISTDGGGIGKTLIQPTSITPALGYYNNGGLDQVKNSDETYLDISSALIDRLGMASATEATFRVNTANTNVETLTVNYEAHAAPSTTKATVMIWLWDWTTNKYKFFKSTNLPTNSKIAVSFTLDANITKYVNASGDVKVLVRGHVPFVRERGKVTNAPPQFQLRTDLAQVQYTTKS